MVSSPPGRRENVNARKGKTPSQKLLRMEGMLQGGPRRSSVLNCVGWISCVGRGSWDVGNFAWVVGKFTWVVGPFYR